MSSAAPKTGTEETRSILAPTGNQVPVSEQQRRTKPILKKPPEKPKMVIPQSPEKPASAAAAAVARRSVTADSSSDSTSSSTVSSPSGTNVKSGKIKGTKRIKNFNGAVRAAKIVPDKVPLLPVKRCDWITPNSEPLYTSFHDDEWGVPVHDDNKLFELLVLSQSLAELSWPLILSKRGIFRKLFNDFDPKAVANLDEERLISMRVHGGTLLSEPKLRAIMENAKQLLKIQQEFGSFSNYCWRFVNHKPIKNGTRYARHVPAKTPKSEFISKDLMQRGFRCVGPIVVYSFMQVSGMVNDHLVTCFRYSECGHQAEKVDTTPQLDERAEEPTGEKKLCTSYESSDDQSKLSS